MFRFRRGVSKGFLVVETRTEAKLLPLAVAWAESSSHYILDTGAPLTPHEMQLARSVGVIHPERVRIKIVAAVP